MATMAVLTNDFHHSECVIRVPEDGWLSVSQVRRIRKALCGMEDCTCGDALGMRGRQDWEIWDEDTRPGARPVRIGLRFDEED